MTLNYNYTTVGVYTVTLRVTDEQSQVSEPATHAIIVDERPPYYASLIDRKAWPEKHRHDISKFGDINIFTVKVINLGTEPVQVKVIFKVYDGRMGLLLGTIETAETTLATTLETQLLTVDFDVTARGTPTYKVYVVAQCGYVADTPEPRAGWPVKFFRVTVVP